MREGKGVVEGSHLMNALYEYVYCTAVMVCHHHGECSPLFKLFNTAESQKSKNANHRTSQALPTSWIQALSSLLVFSDL